LILALIQPPAHHHRPATARAPCGQVLAMACRGLPALPADDEARTVVTARAPAITVSDGDARSPGTAERECEEPVLTG
jgi:hypothetical protein